MQKNLNKFKLKLPYNYVDNKIDFDLLIKKIENKEEINHEHLINIYR
jgi:hypothetical protein